MFFHGYNFLSPSSTFCFIVSSLVPSPSPLVDSHCFNFCSTVSLLVSSSYSMVLAFVLASNGRLSVFLPTFLSSHLYKYWHKRGGLVEVSLHSNFFCALFFCLMVFFFFPFRRLFLPRVLNLLLLGYLIGALLLLGMFIMIF